MFSTIKDRSVNVMRQAAIGYWLSAISHRLLATAYRGARPTPLLALWLFAATASAQDKINYQDHILPLIEANCSKCHNADKKKADLELTSYQGLLKGSGSGPVAISGNPDGSKLWKALAHSEEPFMPPNRPKLDEKELQLFRKWMAGGLLETAGGTAIAAVTPGTDLALKADAIAKPEGPPPMPKDWPATPATHFPRMNAITGLATSPWAPLAAVAGPRQLLLFQADTGDLLGVLPFTEGQPAEVQFSRNGQLLLACGGRGARSGRVMIWEVVSGKRVATLGDEYDTILTADIRADQSQVALGGPSRLVKIFSTKAGELQHKIKKHTEWVTAVAFSPNGEMLATADRNGGLSIWDPDNAQELFTLPGHKSGVTGLSWRGDSRLLASASEDGTVKLWELKEGKQVKSWNAHSGGVLSVNYSHDGRLITCGRDKAIILWDGTGGKVRALAAPDDLPLRATFTHDSEKVIASDFAGHVCIWDVKDGKRAGNLDANPEPPPAAAQPPVKQASRKDEPKPTASVQD